MSLSDRLLKSTFRNVSGAPLFCNYLGITGTTLQADEERSELGSPSDICRNSSIGHPRHYDPQINQLASHLDGGQILIVATPTVVLQDETDTDKAWVLSAPNDNVAVTDLNNGGTYPPVDANGDPAATPVPIGP